MRPIISFITPVYNNSRYLVTAIDSILNQVSKDTSVELIIVDDGSTDDTPQLVDRLADSDSRIRALHQNNQWIYASFNNGIRAASGEYIYILNSDDKLIKGAVKLLLDGIEKYNHPDVIWTKVVCCDVDENQNILSQHEMNEKILKNEYYDQVSVIHERWLFIRESELATNQANLYKREIALKHPFNNSFFAADTLFNIDIADSIKSMGILKENVYVYMSYNVPDMNASIGKYYGYEHEMYNQIMMEEVKIFEKWNCKEEYLNFIVDRRLKALSYEIKILNFSECTMSFEKKIESIFKEIADPLIRRLSRRVNREREYESRVLNGLREFLDFSQKWRDIAEPITALLMYLPDNYLDNVNMDRIDKKAIEAAINSKINVDKIGMVYYSTNW